MATSKNFSLLCLGDSYTIGEGVPLYETFPYLLVQKLRKNKFHFQAPEIIAKTGFTTFELAEQILHTSFAEHYDFVTLLIGVNNQYRNLSIEEYKNDFEFLLKKAIHFTGGNEKHVIVISIPDWGVTPFAKENNAEKIASEIDAYNEANKAIAIAHNCQYINITEETRKAKEDTSLLTADKLHYSLKAHEVWASFVEDVICKQLYSKN